MVYCPTILNLDMTNFLIHDWPFWHEASQNMSNSSYCYSGPYFPAFGLDTEIYGVFLRIQSECGKVQTRITPNTDTFYAVLKLTIKTPEQRLFNFKQVNDV